MGGNRTFVPVEKQAMRAVILGLAVTFTAGCGSAPEVTADVTRTELITNLTYWLTEADKDGDDRLDRAEWQRLSRREFPDIPEAERQRWGTRDFGDLDGDGDSFVSVEELTAPSLLGFDCLDTGGDGRLSSTEREASRQATCLPQRTVSD